MTATTDLEHAPVVDRWADITPLRHGPKARVSAAVARRIFLRTTDRLGIDVGTGPGADLVLHRPDEFFARLGSDGLIGRPPGRAAAGSCGAATRPDRVVPCRRTPR